MNEEKDNIENSNDSSKSDDKLKSNCQNKDCNCDEYIEEEENSGFNAKEIVEIISTFIDKDTVTELTDKVLKHLDKKSEDKVKIRELNLKVGEKNSNYFTIQYWQDLLMVFLVLACISGLSYFKLLETSTIGTLMGSVIGYALGQFRERYRPKN